MANEFDVAKYIRTVEYFNKQKGQKEKKSILDAAPRIAWFRAEHPADSEWQIVTTPTFEDETGSQFRAEIINPAGRVVATGYRFVKATSFENHREKAETQAIARALAVAGYGTIYALESSDDTNDEPSAQPDAPIVHSPKAPAPAPFPPMQQPPSNALDDFALRLALIAEKAQGVVFTDKQINVYHSRAFLALKDTAIGTDEENRAALVKHLTGKDGVSELDAPESAAIAEWATAPASKTYIREWLDARMKQPAAA